MLSRLIIIISIITLLIVPGIFAGCDAVSQEEIDMFANGQIPPIDRLVPENTATATFALG
jgi:hypothetical protein